MAANKLTKEQRGKVLEMLAARETYPTIAQRVGCSVANVASYATRYSEELTKKREQYDAQFINRGLRSREKRIEKLQNLADRIERDLEDKLDPDTFKLVKSGLWYRDVKLSSIGAKVEVDVFAEAMIRQLRGIYDDIAKEQGERKNETKLSGELTINQKGYLGVSPDDWEKQQAQESTGN